MALAVAVAELFEEPASSDLIAIAFPVLASFRANQRSIFVPGPCSCGIVRIVIDETRTPSSASLAPCRLPPRPGAPAP